LVPNPTASGLIALHDFLLVISLFALQFRNHCYLPPISLVTLERTLQVLFGEDRKSMSGNCFFVLVILTLHMFDLALHASLMVVYLYSMFLLFFIYIYIYILGEKLQEFYFFFSWYVRYCMYFYMISQSIAH
jgi:hypothetical protein